MLVAAFTGNLPVRQGVLIGAFVELYRSFGNSTMLQMAHRIANATMHSLVDKQGVLMEVCESGKSSPCNDDQKLFKGRQLVFIPLVAHLVSVYRNFHSKPTAIGRRFDES